MRKTKVLKKVIIFLLVSCLAPVFLLGAPMELSFPRNSYFPSGLNAIDLSVERMGEKEIAVRRLAAEVGAAKATMASPMGSQAVIGETLSLTVSDDGLGEDYAEIFVVVLDGEHGIILVEKTAYDNYDSTTDEYVFPNPGNPGYPEHRITTTQLKYLLNEFDNVIYPTDTAVFGEPLPRGAEGQKVWILIHNIRDEAYYSADAESYIAGYFSASEDAENNKNMMHIDTNDWANRMGPDAERPFMYEGTFAHEFQHLIHFDQDSDEPSWVDEGMADLAGFLCGYGHPAGHIVYYLVYHPIVSLTFWGSGLEDYGASYLFALYLYENFGEEAFISTLVQEQANGIEGIEATLKKFGYNTTFDAIFDSWTMANYLDNSTGTAGKPGYETLDIGSIDTWGYTIESALNDIWMGPPIEGSFGAPSNWFQGIEPQPYTAHYFRYINENAATVSIDGDDYSGVLPNSGTKEWYSEADGWAWRSFYNTFDIPSTGAVLNFTANFDIEEDWDYGYVEVYDHTTGEWTTLEAPGISVTNVAHPQDNPNTPEGREPADYAAAEKWYGFTGSSHGWIPVEMDLSPFAGHKIDIHFRTWQDGAFTLQMMYVDDISIPEIGFYDDVEDAVSTWTADDWKITNGIIPNGLNVTTFEVKKVQQARYPDLTVPEAHIVKNVSSLPIEESTQTGSGVISATNTEVHNRFKISIVTNHANHILSSHYDFIVFQ